MDFDFKGLLMGILTLLIFIVFAIIFMILFFFVMNFAAGLVFGPGSYANYVIIATGLIIGGIMIGGGAVIKFKN